MVFWIIYFLTLAVFSMVLTGWMRIWLVRRAILDAPNDRSNHVQPTPRGGGIAVMLVTMAGVGFILLTRPDLTTGLSPWMIAAAAVVCWVSWQDDLRGLSAAIRLPTHITACAIGVWALPGLGLGVGMSGGLVFQGLLPDWLDAVITVLLWAGFVNFYNFMDGIDAITGVETLGISAGLVLIALLLPAESLPVAGPLALAAAALGFLAWNWPPARLFMGDVGSVTLGYCLGWFLLFLAVRGHWEAAVILPAYYLADAGITLIRRAVRLEKVWQAHREHFYQRAVAKRLAQGAERAPAHRRISAVIGCLNAVLTGLAGLSLFEPEIALVSAGVVTGGVLWWMSR